MTAFLTAFLATWPVWAFAALLFVVALYLLWACEPHEPEPESDPERVAAARAELTAATLAYLASVGESVGHESLDDTRREWGAR